MEGVGDVFLTDVLNTSQFDNGVMNVIWAPCGSGKTTAAIEKILPLASAPRKAIYLIDTKLGKERLALQKKELTAPSIFYAESITDPHCGFFEDDDKVCVTTYAQFGVWCYRYPQFEQNFEVIVCDEPQNLVNFSEIGKWRPGEVNVNIHRCARRAICDAVNWGKVIVTGITATPKPLEKLACDLKCVPIDRTNLHHYVERNTVEYANLDTALDMIQVGQRGGIYMKRVKPMIALGEQLRQRGHNPLMLWSLSNTEFPLSAEQLDARKYIIENEEVPPQYDIFLFNATAETSINLRDKVDFFIAHNPSETSIIQSRGRYRSDIDTLYVYEPKGNIVFPDRYLGIPLTITDLKAISKELKWKKDTKGHELSVDEMLGRLTDYGYNYEESLRNRRKSYVIRKTDNFSG